MIGILKKWLSVGPRCFFCAILKCECKTLSWEGTWLCDVINQYRYFPLGVAIYLSFAHMMRNSNVSKTMSEGKWSDLYKSATQILFRSYFCLHITVLHNLATPQLVNCVKKIVATLMYRRYMFKVHVQCGTVITRTQLGLDWYLLRSILYITDKEQTWQMANIILVRYVVWSLYTSIFEVALP